MPSGSDSRVYPGSRVSFQYNVDTGAIVSQVTYNVTAQFEQWARGSGATPGFPKYKRTNAFSYQLSRRKYPQGTVLTTFSGKPFIRHVGVVTGFQGVRFADAFLPGDFESRKGELIQDVKDKFLDRLKDEKVNVAVAVQERKESMRMLAGFLSTGQSVNSILADADRTAKALRNTKGNRGEYYALRKHADKLAGRLQKLITGSPGVKGKAKLLSNLILQWKYGIKPVLSDAAGLAKKVAEIESQSANRVVRLSSTGSIDISHSVTHPEYLVMHSGKCDVRVFCMYQLSAGHILKSLGLTNPAALLFEATTLSFVADWALNLGSYLGRLDAAVGCSFLDGGVTTFTKMTTQTTTRYASGSYSVDALGVHEIIFVNRTPMTSFPVPEYRGPKNPFSVPNAVSALALAVQRIK